MDALTILSSLWPLFLGALGFAVWLVRLEGRVNQCDRNSIGTDKQIASVDKRVDLLQSKHDALDSRVVQQLADVRESLARIEGALGVGVKQT